MSQQKPDNNNTNANRETDCHYKEQPPCHPERSEGSKHGTVSANGQPQHYEDEIDIIDYIKVIYKHRWMIIAIVLASMLFTGASSLMQPKMYEAYATFFPLSAQSNIETEGIIIKPQLNIEDLIISILESRKMSDRIIEQLNLKKTWNESLLTNVRKGLDRASKINFGKNGIIRLSVQTKTPKLSADIANAYVDNLDYFNKELNLGAQRNIVQVIDKATIPEERMSRDTIRKTAKSGLMFLVLAIFIAFLIEFIQKSNISKRLQEK